MFQGEGVGKEMVNYAAAIPLESIVDILAQVTIPDTPIHACTVKTLELSIQEIHVISRAQELPFMIDDAGRSEADAAATGLPVVNRDTALNFRWIDTRTPENHAIFRIQSGVCQIVQRVFDSEMIHRNPHPKAHRWSIGRGFQRFHAKIFRPTCLSGPVAAIL